MRFTSSSIHSCFLFLSFFLSLTSQSKNADSISKLFNSNHNQTTIYPKEDLKGPKPLEIWMKAYHEAKSNDLIPNYDPTSLSDGEPIYPSHYSISQLSSSNQVCSWTLTKCVMPDE